METNQGAMYLTRPGRRRPSDTGAYSETIVGFVMTRAIYFHVAAYNALDGKPIDGTKTDVMLNSDGMLEHVKKIHKETRDFDLLVFPYDERYYPIKGHPLFSYRASVEGQLKASDLIELLKAFLAETVAAAA